jgi:hypothetical protein
MTNPRIYADFHNADAQGRLRLNCRGTLDDLHRHGIALAEGLAVTLYSEDVEVEGEVQYSPDEKLWVAQIDWNALRQFDDSEQPAGLDHH